MSEQDLPEIIRIQSACYTQIEPETKESLSAKLYASPASCFVATCEDKTIAYLISLPWTFAAPPELNAQHCVLSGMPDCFYLHDVAVDPDIRGTGVGRLLIERYFRCMQEKRLPRGSLIAIQNSTSFWQNFGFRPVMLTNSLREKLSTYGSDVHYLQVALSELEDKQ